jgi:hypothetical protein
MRGGIWRAAPTSWPAVQECGYRMLSMRRWEGGSIGQERLVSKGGAEAGTKQGVVQCKCKCSRGWRGSWRRLASSGRERQDRGSTGGAAAKRRVSCGIACAWMPSTAASVVCQLRLRRTEIPPSPGSGYIRSHPFHRRLALGLAGRRGARLPSALSEPWEPGRQDAAFTGEERRLLGATGRIATESAREVALRTMSSVLCSQAEHQRAGLGGGCGGGD